MLVSCCSFAECLARSNATRASFDECFPFLRPPESVPLQQVIAAMREGKTACAQCLVSSEVPHEIEMFNDAFVSKFGTALDVLRGKRLPELVSLVHGSSPHNWESLLLAASSGAISRCRISAPDAQGFSSCCAPFVPFEEAVFVPIVDDAGGRISHVLVQFPPSILPAPILSDSARILCSRMGLFGRVEAETLGSAQSNPKAARADVAFAISAVVPVALSPADFSQRHSDRYSDQVNALQQLEIASLSGSQTPTALHAIRPRPRIIAGADSKAEAATLADVVITSAMIEALRGQPLPAAARAVGVSATSFKRACRQLGIRRWGFRRGPGRRRCGQET